MRRWRLAVVLATGALALAACTTPPPPIMSQTQAVVMLTTGQPLLRCREACLAAWRSAAPQAAALDAARRWADLAALVETVDYQDDLSLYYLGRAAEGLGYPGAAASYYRQSTYLSGTRISCQVLSRVCGGIALPQTALLRLATIERELGATLYRPTRPSPPRRPLPTVAPPAPSGQTLPPSEPPPPPPLPLAPAPQAPAAPAIEPPTPQEAPAPTVGIFPQPAPIALPPPPPATLPPPVPQPAPVTTTPAGPPPAEYIEPPPAMR